MQERSSQQWVVGVDGSRSSEHALHWAVARGVERSAGLQAIRSWDPSVIGIRSLSALDVAPEPPPALEAELLELIGRIDTTGIPVDWSLQQGPPASVLLEAAEHADLLVVGTRGLGGFKRLVLGSVSHQCATHAAVPVAVIPPDASMDEQAADRQGRIVVGMDGSDNSKAALRWAISFALPDTSVVAIGVWEPSPLATAADQDTFPDLAAETKEEFEAAVEEVMHSTRTDATVTSQFWYANTVETLLREGGSSDLLVVGARGHGRISSALLGSISNRVLHQSTGPVVLVPDQAH